MTLSKVQQKRQPLQPVLPVKAGETKQQMLQTQQSEQPADRSVPPTLKVNGIAFQEGVAGSVAVVNGISVSSGSMVEGAKVEDIQMDRVRFSYSGEKFEVLLGKSNR
jgi:type II secretory pathway component PulC